MSPSQTRVSYAGFLVSIDFVGFLEAWGLHPCMSNSAFISSTATMRSEVEDLNCRLHNSQTPTTGGSFPSRMRSFLGGMPRNITPMSTVCNIAQTAKVDGLKFSPDL
jgi:hypothetical protein